MKERGLKLLFIASMLLLVISQVSGEIIIQEEPKTIYNIGQVIDLPVKVSATNNINDFLAITLSCTGFENEIHKEFLSLITGEEKQIISKIPLIPRFTGIETSNCKLTASINEEKITSREFKISNKIIVNTTIDKSLIKPGEEIKITGTATKENGNPSNGIIEIKIGQNNNQSIKLSDTIKEGKFDLAVEVPSDAQAGRFSIEVIVYEKVNDIIANRGQSYSNIEIEQIPTSLEIITEKREISPEETIKTKVILHDQTGQNIPFDAIITIKDDDNRILQQYTVKTDEYVTHEVPYNQPPRELTIVAASDKLSAMSNIRILEYEKAETKIVNNTLLITNKGNVPFTKTIIVTIGNEKILIDTNIDIDGVKKYTLSAPEGKYEIEISNGDEIIKKSAILTGKTIDVREESGIIKSLITHPMVWIFIIMILGFIAFMIFSKGIKRSFIGYIGRRKQKNAESMSAITQKKDLLIETKSIADLTLSLKGDKQDASIINLKIKNMKEVKPNKKVVEETLNKIAKISEDQKACIYENNDNVFIILAPIKTKTFRNEATALKISQLIKDLIDHNNKMFKQKIEYGLSLNQGTIVAKQEDNELKFMSMGTLMTISKKIASISDKEILLGEEMKTKLSTSIKTQKHTHENLNYYSIVDIKQHNPEHEKFISGFLHRLEKK
jgi:hypothetical protein